MCWWEKTTGTVGVYESVRGTLRQVLFDHAVTISFLEFNDKTDVIICSDQSSRIVCYKLVTHLRSPWEIIIIFETRIPGAITQMLPSPGLGRLLVCTANACLLFAVGPGSINPGTTPIANITWSEDRNRFSWA